LLDVIGILDGVVGVGISPEEEDIIFQSTYKQSTGCKTSKIHGYGYMAKVPTRSQLMATKLEEQARASAAAEQKNIEVQGEVEKLKEKVANLEAEREMIIEESKRQIQQEEEKKREVFKEALREELRQEMLSMLADQKKEELSR
jgi:predicted nuclease with TOPRIM domain